MEITHIRKSSDRGYFDHGWLESYHTFSFAGYHDPRFMGFKSLRVINDDIVAPQTGFDFHPHRNMEIVTYILSGALTHEDNLGNKEEISEGSFQVMTAGSGIIHSEWNHGKEPCHLLQIWIVPNQHNGSAGYKIYKPDHIEKWALVTSKDAMKIKQDADVYVIDSGKLSEINMPKTNKPYLWLHVATGEIELAGCALKAGDAISVKDPDESLITFTKQSKLLLFYMV